MIAWDFSLLRRRNFLPPPGQHAMPRVSCYKATPNFSRYFEIELQQTKSPYSFG